MKQTVDQWLLAGDRDHGRLDLGLVTVDLMRTGQEAPASGAPNRAIISAGSDGSLSTRIFQGGELLDSATLVPGTPLATGWMDWTIEAVQTMPHAAPGFRFEPLPAGDPAPPGQQLLEGVKVRASRGSSVIEHWVAAGWRVSIPAGNWPVEVAYGWEIQRLPFGLVLDNFTVGRNEGSDEPASFRSDLSMVLPDGTVADTGSCSMNSPANYPDAWWRSLTGFTYKISQASWNPNDLAQSSVQVLRDPGWLFKWTGSLVLCAGLLLMFTLRRPAKGVSSNPFPS